MHINDLQNDDRTYCQSLQKLFLNTIESVSEQFSTRILKFRSAENELLRSWNAIPKNFFCLKKFATALLSMFLSTFACESLFSVMNFIKSRNRSSLTDETSSSCISLKVTKYKPDVKSLSAVMQQQKPH